MSKITASRAQDQANKVKQSWLLAALSAGSSVWQRNNKNDPLVEICVKVLKDTDYAATLSDYRDL